MSVFIPVAGDDNSPEFDLDLYESSIVGNGQDGFSLEPSLTLQVSDADTLIDNKCTFAFVAVDGGKSNFSHQS